MTARLTASLSSRTLNRGLPPVSPILPRQIIARTVLVFFLLTSFYGCSTLEESASNPTLAPLKSSGRVTTTGVNQLFDEESFEMVSLPDLLDPPYRNKMPVIGSQPSPDDSPVAKTERLGEAFENFYRKGGDLVQRRNRVQDRLLAASEQRCNTYKNYLKRVETFQSSSTGILTTILGGAGAIATGTLNSRAFAGLAGISSGIGAELKAGFFADLTTQIIVPGIELRRNNIFKEITAKREQSITQYTVELAIRDAALYHGACSLIAGIEEAGVVIKTFGNPGLDDINATLTKLRYSYGAINNLHEPLDATQLQNELQTLDSMHPVESRRVSIDMSNDMPLAVLESMKMRLNAGFVKLAQKIYAQHTSNARQINPNDNTKKTQEKFEILLGNSGGIIKQHRQQAQEALSNQNKLLSECDDMLRKLQLDLELKTQHREDTTQTQRCIADARRDAQVLRILPAQEYVDKVVNQLESANDQIKPDSFTDLESSLEKLKELIKNGIATVSDDRICKKPCP